MSRQLKLTQMAIISALRNFWAHGIILAAATTVTATVRMALHDHYRQERRKIEAQGRQQRTSEIAAVWNSLAYTDAASAKLTDAFLAKINLSTLELSEIQKAKLGRRLEEVLNYLQSPSLDEYYRLKTEGLHYRFKPFEPSNEVLQFASNIKNQESYRSASAIRMRAAVNSQSHDGNSEALAPDAEASEHSNPRATVQRRWNSMIEISKAWIPPKVSAICLDHIAIAVSRTNSPSALLDGKATKGFTTATYLPDPGFNYAPTTPGQSMPDLFVHLSLFARSNTSTNAGPVYLSLYWSEPDQQWALSGMITDALLKMKLLF